MKVMKFGGTSVGSVNSILSVKRIVESAGEPVIVVVSALGGITDKLINTSKMAAAGDSAYEGEFREIVYRHVEMIKEVIPAGAGQVALQRQIGELLNELKDIFQGIYLIRDLSPKTSDTIVSYGERLSSIIVAELIDEAKWFDSRTFIKTEKKHNKHTIDADLTNQLVKEAFHSIPKVSLVPGFISSDKVSGDVTNLGRGGSDYTAAIIAAALDASSLEIWTDVDGFMTADPRVISTAYTISELSYVEATELCNFGAKVVYPPTIYPVCHKNIPIIIKNTFNPDGVGTVIKQETSNPQSKAIKGISSINDTSLITVQGLGMVGVIGVNYRIFKALAKNGISVFLVSQASSENSTSIGVRNADADLACEVLNEEFAKEINFNKALFPGIQGGPLMHIIAAKAVAFGEALKPEFKVYQQNILDNCRVFAEALQEEGFRIVSGGTDNHLILVDVRGQKLTGKIAEHLLDEVGVTCNKNTIPFDPESPFVTSGIRLGTAAVTTRGFKQEDMREVAAIIGLVLNNPENEEKHKEAAARVAGLCAKYPMYPGF